LNAKLYLCSPEVAAVSALKGEITDPRTFGEAVKVLMPEVFPAMEHLFVKPAEHPEVVKVLRGENIRPLPRGQAMSETLAGEVLLRLEDDVTTDDILPGGARIMALRSNIPAISQCVFSNCAQGFAKEALDKGGGFIVAGRNYGQGSSREHAALAPMFLGIKGVLALSFARIHRSNLINFGMLPMTFLRPEDRQRVQPGDRLIIEAVASGLKEGRTRLRVMNETQGRMFEAGIDLDEIEREFILAGGRLNYFRLKTAIA
jgi:aconitate hydratase